MNCDDKYWESRDHKYSIVTKGAVKRISHLFNSSIGQKSDTDLTKPKPRRQEALGENHLHSQQNSLPCDYKISVTVPLLAASRGPCSTGGCHMGSRPLSSPPSPAIPGQVLLMFQPSPFSLVTPLTHISVLLLHLKDVLFTLAHQW